MEEKLIWPVDKYSTGEYLKFGDKIRRHIFLWATHLGDDVVAPAGTEIKAIASGEVVWSEMRLGSIEKRNWGGVMILKHDDVYSVYGHMKDLKFKVGMLVNQGDVLGVVAAGGTPENGFWKQPHLHFAIYTGPWKDEILPGYKRPEEFRTKLKWWENPRDFISARS